MSHYADVDSFVSVEIKYAGATVITLDIQDSVGPDPQLRDFNTRG